MRQVRRYNPMLVTLHWLLAVLILGMLAIGFIKLANTPNTDPAKIGILRLHMATGIAIFGLMVIRFIVRTMTRKPPEAPTGVPVMDKLAPVSHYGFYVVVLLMVGTGYATGLLAGLPAIVFGSSGAPLPPTFATYAPFQWHAGLALVLVALIALHIGAVLWHHLVVHDHLIRRMAFGRGSATEPESR